MNVPTYVWRPLNFWGSYLANITMHNLLNDVMYNLVLQYIRKMGKREKEDDPI